MDEISHRHLKHLTSRERSDEAFTSSRETEQQVKMHKQEEEKEAKIVATQKFLVVFLFVLLFLILYLTRRLLLFREEAFYTSVHGHNVTLTGGAAVPSI